MKRIIAAILALILAVSLCGCGSTGGTKSGDDTKSVVSLRMGEDKSSLLISESQTVSFDTALQSGYVTADRGHIITLAENGELSYSDSKQENVVEIEKKAESISNIRNDGFFFTDEKDITYRVRFGAGEIDKLGEDVVFAVAKNTTSVLYATVDGDIYTLAAESTEAEKVGTFDDSVLVVAISDNAGIAVWLLNDGDEYTPVIRNGEDKKTCEAYSAYFSGFTAEFSKDQKMVVMGSYFSNTVYIVKEGEDAVKIALPDELSNGQFFSANGRVYTQNAADIASVFVTVEASSGVSLYSLTLDGDKERLLSGIGSMKIQGGRVIYLNEDDDLCYAPVTSSGVGEEKKISGDADQVDFAEMGEYLFFTKNADDDTATLCAYSFKDDSVQKISGDVSRKGYNVSTDGATVFFFKNVEKVKDTYSYYGELYRWTYAKDAESEKIASDVLTNSLTSLLDSGELDKNAFLLERFNAVTENAISYDLLKYDGKEAVKLQSDLIKPKSGSLREWLNTESAVESAAAEAPAESAY